MITGQKKYEEINFIALITIELVYINSIIIRISNMVIVITQSAYLGFEHVHVLNLIIYNYSETPILYLKT